MLQSQKMKCLVLSRYPHLDPLKEKCQAQANSILSENVTSGYECRKCGQIKVTMEPLLINNDGVNELCFY